MWTCEYVEDAPSSRSKARLMVTARSFAGCRKMTKNQQCQKSCYNGIQTNTFVVKKTFSCSNLSAPKCHATRKKYEGWDTARLPKYRQGKSRDDSTTLPPDRLVIQLLAVPGLAVLRRAAPRPRPRPLAQKPDCKAVVFGGKCKCKTVVEEQFVTHVPTSQTGGARTLCWSKSFSCSTLSVPSCHATRRKHEGWGTARLPKPRQGKSRGRGGVRTSAAQTLRSTAQWVAEARSVIPRQGSFTNPWHSVGAPASKYIHSLVVDNYETDSVQSIRCNWSLGPSRRR
ncbi:hypothetical protein CSKR_109181 [Clonorchis sinensis]|uniref:Uncharacterized protein n=1 Tax=Clonorchis sinensis TaxID=79923 RepID=A0A419Q346_CLOSI|nr:hypothetical protein CSKR_109181 [Clonorchis sinensis]